MDILIRLFFTIIDNFSIINLNRQIVFLVFLSLRQIVPINTVGLVQFNLKRFAMDYPTNTEEIFIPPELYKSDANKVNLEELESMVIDEDTRPTAYRGIFFALIICIPFWLLVAAVYFWMI